MEVAVADVAGDRVDEMRLVFVQKGIQFRQEFRVAGGRYDEVINEGRGVETVDILPQEVEALATDNPILLRLFFIFLYPGLQVEVGERLFGRQSFGVGGLNRVFGEFRDEDELRHAARGDHHCFGNEINTEPCRFEKAHLLQHLGEEFHCEREGVVVKGFKRFGVLGEDPLHNLRENVEIGEENDEHRAMLFGLHEA